MKKYNFQNYLEPLFFMLAPIYWLPTLGLYGAGLISFIKITLLILLSVFLIKDFFITKRSNKVTIIDIVLLIFLISNFIYYIFNQTNSEPLLMSVLFIIFYRQGFQTRYKKFVLNPLFIYFYIFLYLNIIFSLFINQLNFENPLFLLKENYEYWITTGTIPKLSSTGYGLARTSWAFSIILYTCYIFVKLDFSKKKNITLAKIYIILMFLSQIVIGSKFGIFVSFLLVLYFFSKKYTKK